MINRNLKYTEKSYTKLNRRDKHLCQLQKLLEALFRLAAATLISQLAATHKQRLPQSKTITKDSSDHWHNNVLKYGHI